MRRINYNTLDIVGLAGIAVISGVIFIIASNYIYPAITGLIYIYPIMNLLWPIMYGFWAIGGTIGGYIIRKPASAFLGEFLGSIVEMILSSYFGVTSIIYGVLEGIASEIGFAIWSYNRWDYLSMALAGALPGLAVILPGWIFLPGFFDAVFQIAGYAGIFAYILVHMTSGLIIAGLITKYLIDRIAKTGILSLFLKD